MTVAERATYASWDAFGPAWCGAAALRAPGQDHRHTRPLGMETRNEETLQGVCASGYQLCTKDAAVQAGPNSRKP